MLTILIAILCGILIVCKGDSTAQSAETNQSSFASQLMSAFSTQFKGQSDLLNYVQNNLKDIVNRGGVGFDNSTLTSMRTSATDTTSIQMQNAQKALQQRQAINGDADLPSGVAAQQSAQLATAAATQNAQEQNQININNGQLKQQSYWTAISGLNNVAGQMNPLGYAGAGTSADNAVANLSEANTAANANSFTGSFMKGLGSSLGNSVGSVAGKGVPGFQSLYGG